ncbi:CDP-alcohol phosphatidyltransferase family protein [Gorillibacterium timonense]|uniref:CDP-alcohol phosphatidyltransferase family protein n=1 Tax=Gorillibacterium timonense TaxID=1689269 RepID=UPI0009E7557C|nr:CDP-alcohol phosphatidyltransferase family protein [Gorillibacterium timonense]
MTLPNVLTLLRFLLIPVYLYVFLSGHEQPAFLIMLLAGLTDVLDGHIARKRQQVTELGSMLDPLADKLMMLTVVFSLLYIEWIPWQAAVAVVFRDAGMIAAAVLFKVRGKKTVPANAMGKLTTVLFYLAILLIVMKVNHAVPFLWVVIAFSFLTTLIYAISVKRVNEEEGEAGALAGVSGFVPEKEELRRKS